MKLKPFNRTNMQSDNLNLTNKLPVTSNELIKKLDEWRIVYKHFTHEPLMTVKESKSIQEKLFGKTKGNGHIKNLYLRDKRKNNILFVTHQDTVVNLKSLAEKIKMQRLSFGSPDRLMETLGVLPGAVSPFAMINGVKKNVNLFLDINLSSFKKIFAHPLENNQTIEISIDQLQNFLKKISVTPNWISIENNNK
jgi:Ala-tRNA(Pro) deacylase